MSKNHVDAMANDFEFFFFFPWSRSIVVSRHAADIPFSIHASLGESSVIRPTSVTFQFPAGIQSQGTPWRSRSHDDDDRSEGMGMMKGSFWAKPAKTGQKTGQTGPNRPVMGKPMVARPGGDDVAQQWR
jgi:hypothetical protein